MFVMTKVPCCLLVQLENVFTESANATFMDQLNDKSKMQAWDAFQRSVRDFIKLFYDDAMIKIMDYMSVTH